MLNQVLQSAAGAFHEVLGPKRRPSDSRPPALRGQVNCVLQVPK
ncbi:hypothetical protein C4K22_1269 [Pseudomonas chlororaphis subsp. aurantiaca]|nr:hypothetical protein C4K22_1269 [Pseudomonas chlororaphis subsp. aurantiaca]AZD40365.1 hypothetical protein C4K21_1272 [Pseudomonas chlororaphis subsp. aurantiaca]